MRDFIDTVVISIVVGLMIGFGVFGRVEERVKGAYSLPLVAKCELWVLDTSLQPEVTAVVVCPDMGLMKVWPRPVEYPWGED